MKQLFIITSLLCFTSDLWAKRVVLIGDSHSVGFFGMELDRLLRSSEEYKVATYAACGSTPAWFYTGWPITCGWFIKDQNGNLSTGDHRHRRNTPLLRNILKINTPDIVIIQMGGNFVPDLNEASAIANMQKIIADIKKSGSRCLWVGTPDMRTYRNQITPNGLETKLEWITRVTKKAVGNSCSFINGRDYTHYPNTGGDGVHYWHEPGITKVKLLAKAVYEKFLKMYEETKAE